MYWTSHDTLLTDTGLQDHALNLVLALQALPASRVLLSSSGEKNLFSDLSRLKLAINSGDFDVRRVLTRSHYSSQQRAGRHYLGQCL